MANQVVGSMSEWSGVLKDLFRQIDEESITLPNLQAFLERRNPFDVSDIDWQKTYAALGMEAEYAEAISLLGVKEDPNFWVVPVVKGVTCNKVVAGLRKLKVGVCAQVDDIDKGVTTNDRDPNRDGSYVIGFRRTVEADKENKNLSDYALAKQNHKGITLQERLLLGLGYFLTTGQHLDVKNVTLCSGSRNQIGFVPRLCWVFDARQVYINWRHPGDCRAFLCSRSAVSFPAQS